MAYYVPNRKQYDKNKPLKNGVGKLWQKQTYFNIYKDNLKYDRRASCSHSKTN